MNDIVIRQALSDDIDDVERIYDEIHAEEEQGRLTVGWKRGVYPTRETAVSALKRKDLFVVEANGRVAGAAIINKIQVDVYESGSWLLKADPDDVMVLHTLVISPSFYGHGLGKAFISFYEKYALSHGARYLRLDTNERNGRARAMYASLGYREAGIVPTVFNGIDGVNLVLLEKKL